MNEEILNLLDEEIKFCITELSEIKPGSEEYSAVTENLATLYKLRLEYTKSENEHYKLKIEEDKNEKEFEDKEKSRSHDGKFKQSQIDEAKRDRNFKIATTAAELALYGAWFVAGLTFEKTGSLVSPVFKNLWSHFRPIRK